MMKKTKQGTAVVPVLLLSLSLVCACMDDIERPEADNGAGKTGAGEGRVFTGTIEQGTPATKSLLGGELTKTTVGEPDGSYRHVYWGADDEVGINGRTYRVSARSSDARKASFEAVGTEAEPEGGKYRAYYPASIRKNATTVTLPQTQYYGGIDAETGRPLIKNLPMYAESDGLNLDFRNLCAVLHLRVKAAPISEVWAANQYSELETVTKIEVTTTSYHNIALKPLWGDFTVSLDGSGNPQLSGGNQNNHTVTLDCTSAPGGGVQLSSTDYTDFIIALPPTVFEPVLPTTSGAAAPPFTVKLYRKKYAIETSVASDDLNFASIVREKEEPLDMLRNYWYTAEEGLEIVEESMTMVLAPSSIYDVSHIPIEPRLRENYPASLVTQWGDGAVGTAIAGTQIQSSVCSHVYNSTEDYKVTVTSRTVKGGYQIVFGGGCRGVKAFTSPLLKIGPGFSASWPTDDETLISIDANLFVNNEGLGLNGSYLDRFFARCRNLVGWGWDIGDTEVPHKGIPPDLLKPLKYATTLVQFFADCRSLTGSIPPNLLKSLIFVTDIRQFFEGCQGLTGGIPQGFFDNNRDLYHIENFFNDCYALNGEIPARLFDNNPKILNFIGVFADTALSGEIPPGLFAKNTEAESFGYTFMACRNLSGEIPADLFVNNTKAGSFYGTFIACSNLGGEIPAGLFENNVKAISFNSTFSGCRKLKLRSDIFTGTSHTPSSRFAGLSESEKVIFTSCFYNVGSSLGSNAGDGGTAPELWNYTYSTAGYTSTSCFGGVNNATNSAAIPTDWK